MFKLYSSEKTKVAHIQKLANQLMLNSALLIEMVNNTFSESKKTFGRLIKRETFQLNKNKIQAVKNIFPLDFASYSEVQKKSKDFNVQIGFKKEESLF